MAYEAAKPKLKRPEPLPAAELEPNPQHLDRELQEPLREPAAHGMQKLIYPARSSVAETAGMLISPLGNPVICPSAGSSVTSRLIRRLIAWQPVVG